MRPWLDAPADPTCERAAREALLAGIGAQLGVEPTGLRVVAGGSEANNLAVLTLGRRPPRRVLAQPTEHPSLLRALERLTREGVEVRMVGVDGAGRVDPDEYAQEARRGASLAVLMRANNETGVLQPVEAVAAALAPLGIGLHVDAVQSARFEPPLPAALGASTVALTAHKLDGPKGVAALAGPGASALPQPWTAPGLPLLAGLSAALARRARLGASEARAVEASRDTLERALLAAVPGLVVTGAGAPRLPGHLHLRCPGISGEALCLELDRLGIAVSTGAACAAGEPGAGPSHVLLALGLDARAAAASLRLSLPRALGADERERVCAALRAGVARLRGLAGPTAPR